MEKKRMMSKILCIIQLSSIIENNMELVAEDKVSKMILFTSQELIKTLFVKKE